MCPGTQSVQCIFGTHGKILDSSGEERSLWEGGAGPEVRGEVERRDGGDVKKSGEGVTGGHR